MKFPKKILKCIFIILVVLQYFASSLTTALAYSGAPKLVSQSRGDISVNERLELGLESINEGDEATQDEEEPDDEKTTGNLEITKVDADDVEKLLEGAEFQLYYEEDDNKYFLAEDDEENIIWVESEEDATILTTDEHGELLVEGLPEGDYFLLETQAPEGYITPEEDEAIMGITITAGETTEETIKNTLDTGDLRITKVDIDDEEKLLEGAEFKLYYEEDDKKFYFHEGDEGKFTWVEKEDKATILTTNEKGELLVEGLPVGTYFLVETQAPERYVTPEEEKAITEVIIERDEKTEETIENTLDTGDLKVIKVDADDEKELLEGAEFKLYYEDDDKKFYFHEDDEGKITWVEKEDKATTLTTDEKGELLVEGLPVGTYSLVEMQAPEKYVTPKDEKAVTEVIIESDEKTEETIKNTLDTGDLKVIKVDADDEEKLLEGAEFKLYYEEDDKKYYYSVDDEGNINWVEKEKEATILTTDEKGELSVEGLVVGTYSLVEINAPEGYVIPEEDKAIMEITITSDEKTEEIIANAVEDAEEDKEVIGDDETDSEVTNDEDEGNQEEADTEEDGSEATQDDSDESDAADDDSEAVQEDDAESEATKGSRSVVEYNASNILLSPILGYAAEDATSTLTLNWLSSMGSKEGYELNGRSLTITPTQNETQTAILQVNFQLAQGLTAEPYDIEIRIPASIFSGRDNLPAEVSKDIPLISREEVLGGDSNNELYCYYIDILTGEIVITNYKAIDVNADSGVVFQIAYQFAPYQIKNGYFNDKIKATAIIKSSQTNIPTDPLDVTVNTKVDAGTVKKVHASNEYSYTWDSNWGTEPVKADGESYFYIQWRLSYTPTGTSTQPYTVYLQDIDDSGVGEILGYRKYSGGSAYTFDSSGIIPIPFDNPKPFDNSSMSDETVTYYVLVRYRLSIIDKPEENDLPYTTSGGETTVRLDNSAAATVVGKDGGTEEVEKYSASMTKSKVTTQYVVPAPYIWKSFTISGGTDPRSLDIYGAADALEAGNSFDVYQKTLNSNPYGWHLTKDEDTQAYGVHEYKTETIDEQLYLGGSTIYSQNTRLKKGDYEFTTFSLRAWDEYDYTWDDSSQSWKSTITKDPYTSYSPVEVYCKTLDGGDDWELYVTLEKQSAGVTKYTKANGETGTKTIVNSASAGTLELPAGTYAVKFSNTNKRANTTLRPTLTTKINPTDHVLSIIEGTTGPLYNQNVPTLIRTDYKGVETKASESLSVTTDIWKRLDQATSMTKTSTAEKDNSHSLFTIKNNITMYEKIGYSTTAFPEADFLINDVLKEQTEGVFYDLLPMGTELDYSSIKVKTYGNEETCEPWVETVHNWQGSGQTMLIVHVEAPKETNYKVITSTASKDNPENAYVASGFILEYELIYPWMNAIDYGTTMINQAAYRGIDELTSGTEAGATYKYFQDLGNTGENDDTNQDTVYAQKELLLDSVGYAQYGGSKAVKATDKTSYESATEVAAGGTYTYRLRYQYSATTEGSNTEDTVRNLIVYDVLEAAAGSGWRGTLQSIDTSQPERLGAKPVIYYSTTTGLDSEAPPSISDTNVWTQLEDNDLSKISDLSKVTAIAIDLSQNDFYLTDQQSIMCYVTMEAPADYEANQSLLAKNNAIFSGTIVPLSGNVTSLTVPIGPTEVSLRAPDIEISKTSDPASGSESNPAVVKYKGSLTYEVAVENTNIADTIKAVKITDDIPVGLEVYKDDIMYYSGNNPLHAAYVTDSDNVHVTKDGQELTFTVDKLLAGEKITFVIPTTVIAPEEKTFKNTATITEINGAYYTMNSDTTYHKTNGIPDFNLQKVGVDDQPLKNVKFTLYGGWESIPNRSAIPTNPGDWYWEAVDIGEDLITDKDGWLPTISGQVLDEMLSGKYEYLILEETRAPEGYETPVNKWLIYFENGIAIEKIEGNFTDSYSYTGDDGETVYVYQILDIAEAEDGLELELIEGEGDEDDYYQLKNVLATELDLTFTKIDAEEGFPLTYAEFLLYYEEDGTKYYYYEDDDGNVTWEDEDNIDYLYDYVRWTEDDGSIIFKNLQEGKKYILEELYAEYRDSNTGVSYDYRSAQGHWEIVVGDSDENGILDFSIVTVADVYDTSTFPIKKGANGDYTLKNARIDWDNAFWFYKVSSQNGNYLGGAKFTLYQDNGTGTLSELVDSDNPNQGGWEVHSTTTSYNDDSWLKGFVYFGELEEGIYQLVETEAPSGFKLPSGQWRIVVDGAGNIDIQTVPAADGAETPTLELVNEDAESGYKEYALENTPKPFDLIKVDENKDPLNGAKFYLYEKQGISVFSITESTTNSDLLPTTGKGSYYFYSDGTYGEYYDSNNSLYQWMKVDEYTSGYDGSGDPIDPGLIDIGSYFANSYGGTFQLIEFDTVDGYEVPTGQWRITVDSNGIVTSIETIQANDGTTTPDIAENEETGQYELVNVAITGDFEFTKVDGNTGEPLPGAEFTLFKAIGDVDDYDLVVIDDVTGFPDEKWKKFNDYTSSLITLGLVSLSDLTPGTYQLVETKAPDGYHTPTGQWRITVATDGKVDFDAIYTIYELGSDWYDSPYIYETWNNPGEYRLANAPYFTFTKVDEEGNPLPGAKFTLYQEYMTVTRSLPSSLNTRVVASEVVSDENGVVNLGVLDYGSPAINYVLEEIEPPSGYELPEDKLWLIQSDSGVTITNISATKSEITLPSSSDTGYAFSDIITVADKEGGTPLEIELNDGEYQLVNKAISTTEFEFKKVDPSEENKVLPGAEFQLYYEDANGDMKYYSEGDDGVEWVDSAHAATITTSTDSNSIFKNLKVGTTYYLVETKAPQGYQLPTGYWEITVELVETTDEETGETTSEVKATISDFVADGGATAPPAVQEEDGVSLIGNLKSFELPITGNGGIYWLIALGCLLLAIGLARLKYMRRGEQSK